MFLFKVAHGNFAFDAKILKNTWKRYYLPGVLSILEEDVLTFFDSMVLMKEIGDTDGKYADPRYHHAYSSRNHYQ